MGMKFDQIYQGALAGLVHYVNDELALAKLRYKEATSDPSKLPHLSEAVLGQIAGESLGRQAALEAMLALIEGKMVEAVLNPAPMKTEPAAPPMLVFGQAVQAPTQPEPFVMPDDDDPLGDIEEFDDDDFEDDDEHDEDDFEDDFEDDDDDVPDRRDDYLGFSPFAVPAF